MIAGIFPKLECPSRQLDTRKTEGPRARDNFSIRSNSNRSDSLREIIMILIAAQQ